MFSKRNSVVDFRARIVYCPRPTLRTLASLAIWGSKRRTYPYFKPDWSAASLQGKGDGAAASRAEMGRRTPGNLLPAIVTGLLLRRVEGINPPPDEMLSATNAPVGHPLRS